MPFDQINKPAILRPLGGIEKLFWLISQNRQTHFAITAEVAGSSQVAQWQGGLDRIFGQLPVIWSRIVSDSRGAADGLIFRSGFTLPSTCEADCWEAVRISAFS